MRPSTRAVRSGTGADPGNDLTPPLHQSSVYYAESVAEAAALEDPKARLSSYTRTANPTVVRFEEALADLEGAPAAVATPSGMAALTLAFLTFLTRADTVAVSPHSYADTLAVLAELSGRVGFEVVVTEDLDRPDATVVVAETPSNPMLRTVDLDAVSAVTRRTGALLIVDSTMATPVNLRPLEHGADLVVHSASKYLAGHFAVIAGVAAGRAELVERMRGLRTLTGLCLDPHSAWLLLQGLQTLHVRVAAQNAAALRIARFLAGHPAVDFVAYPGLGSPDAGAQAMTGYGGVLTFGLRAGTAAVAPFLEALRLCTIAVSLGGTRTVIEAPALMSHVQGGPDNPSLGVIPANAIRLSVGLEDVDDLIEDLAAALSPARVVAEVVASVLGLPSVSAGDRLRRDLGMDSLTGTYVLAQLKQRTGLELPLPELLDCGTVADLAALADERAGAAR